MVSLYTIYLHIHGSIYTGFVYSCLYIRQKVLQYLLIPIPLECVGNLDIILTRDFINIGVNIKAISSISLPSNLSEDKDQASKSNQHKNFGIN